MYVLRQQTDLYKVKIVAIFRAKIFSGSKSDELLTSLWWIFFFIACHLSALKQRNSMSVKAQAKNTQTDWDVIVRRLSSANNKLSFQTTFTTLPFGRRPRNPEILETFTELLWTKDFFVFRKFEFEGITWLILIAPNAKCADKIFRDRK